ncbi:MAG TPA: hypothetical protein VGH74_07580 [Planctomycetaceae bacterium]|jgi:hypothetical protein
MQSFASRAAFLAACQAPRRYGSFTLPVCGVTVQYRSLSDLEFSEFQMAGMKRNEEGQMLSDEDRMRDSRPRLICLCLCDDAGERLLNDGDQAAVAGMNSADVVALNAELRRFVGLDTYRQQQADLKKNSNTTPADDSPAA